MPRNKTSSKRAAEEVRLHAARKVWEQERFELMGQLRELNATLERLEKQHLDWGATIRSMRAAKELLMSALSGVNRKIGEFAL